MSRVSGPRATCFGTCGECGNRQKLTIHPNDTGGETITIRCPDCRKATEHLTGGIRFVSNTGP